MSMVYLLRVTIAEVSIATLLISSFPNEIEKHHQNAKLKYVVSCDNSNW